jgi:hypothetical protein
MKFNVAVSMAVSVSVCLYDCDCMIRESSHDNGVSVDM